MGSLYQSPTWCVAMSDKTTDSESREARKPRSLEHYRRVAIFFLGGLLTLTGASLLALDRAFRAGWTTVSFVSQQPFWYEFTAANLRLGFVLIILGFAWYQLIRLPRWALIVTPLITVLFIVRPQILLRLLWTVGLVVRSLIPALIAMIPFLIGMAPILALLYIFRKSLFRTRSRKKRRRGASIQSVRSRTKSHHSVVRASSHEETVSTDDDSDDTSPSR